MAERETLVIDAGTSAMRAVGVGPNGAVTAIASEPWHVFTPDDAAPWGRELRPSQVAAALGRLLDSAAERGMYGGIAFTGQREGLVFLDDHRSPVLISPNVDARASAEGLAIDSVGAAEVYRTTGHLPSLMQAPAKLAWLRTHHPEAAAAVRAVLPLSDWLASSLTGETIASRCLLVENGMLDITSGAAPASLWSSFGAPTNIIPACAADGSVVGRAVHRSFGDLCVVSCGGDTQCALVGMGALEPGMGGVPAGWSAPVQIVTSVPILDAEMRTWAGMHVVPERWVVESNAGETGRVWQWLCSMLGMSASDASAAAAASRIGAGDVMIALGPAPMNAAAMNASVGGITLPLPIVMSAPERGDLLRAMLESIACAIRANLEQAEMVAGLRVQELRLGGGMSRSEVFSQIVADVLDRPVIVASTPETSALGAAALAAPALGVHDSLAGAVSAMTAAARIVEPETRTAAEYEDVYQRWLATCVAFESMP